MKFYQVKVQFTSEEGKKQNVNYLVDAQSVTESEAVMTAFLEENDETNFEVKSSNESRIFDVIMKDDGVTLESGEIE